jgi:hypothetical protein
MCSAGYTEINKSTRIDSILRLSKDSIEGYQSRHNSNLLLKQNNLIGNNRGLNASASFDNGNKINQRIIYTKNKSKSKILDESADYNENDDDDDDAGDDDDKTSLARIVNCLNILALNIITDEIIFVIFVRSSIDITKTW